MLTSCGRDVENKLYYQLCQKELINQKKELGLKYTGFVNDRFDQLVARLLKPGALKVENA
jgi:hypothetical protein